MSGSFTDESSKSGFVCAGAITEDPGGPSPTWTGSYSLCRVQAVLRENFPKAIYVHCNAHQLNLVLCSAAKEFGYVSTFFWHCEPKHSFFTGAQQHARSIEIQSIVRAWIRARDTEIVGCITGGSRWMCRNEFVWKSLFSCSSYFANFLTTVILLQRGCRAHHYV